VSARKQNGTTTVEFAIIGALMLAIMLSVIEFGRALFSFAVLNEGVRRGARVAAVCQLNDPAIVQTVMFASVPGLRAGNVTVEYLNDAGNAIANPNGSFLLIRYVRVRVVGYQMQLAIPFMSSLISAPQFSATFPRESLGIPREGEITPCVPG
jgi:hypothetical protein